MTARASTHSFTIDDDGSATLTPAQEILQAVLRDKNRVQRGHFVRDVDDGGNAHFYGYMRDPTTGERAWRELVPGEAMREQAARKGAA
jgi:hypothetical protein